MPRLGRPDLRRDLHPRAGRRRRPADGGRVREALPDDSPAGRPGRLPVRPPRGLRRGRMPLPVRVGRRRGRRRRERPARAVRRRAERRELLPCQGAVGCAERGPQRGVQLGLDDKTRDRRAHRVARDVSHRVAPPSRCKCARSIISTIVFISHENFDSSQPFIYFLARLMIK